MESSDSVLERFSLAEVECEVVLIELGEWRSGNGMMVSKSGGRNQC